MVNKDKLDDIIEIAQELSDNETPKVTIEEVKSIGEELGLEPEKVDEAIAELQRREVNEIALKAKKALWFKIGSVGVGLIVLLSIMAFWGSYSGAKQDLVYSLEMVNEQKAKFLAVKDRQNEIQTLFDGRDPSVRSDDELTGSINRVAVERKRYDEAASAYNAAAKTKSLWVKVGGFPDSVPMSYDIE